MGPRGLYLNHWMPDFDLEVDVPLVTPIFVFFHHPPLHYWSDDSMVSIGNTLLKCIDKYEIKAKMFTYARIYVEVVLEKGSPKAITPSLENWSHLEKLEYEQPPFKSKSCHEYSHFTKDYKIIAPIQTPLEKEDQWQ